MTIDLKRLPTSGSTLSRHWRNDAARSIAVDVEFLLRRQNVPMSPETLALAGHLSGLMLMAISSLSPAHRHAIESANALLPDAVSRLVLSLATEIDERLKRSQPASGNADAAGATPDREFPQGRFALMQSWAGEVAGQTFIEDELRIPRSTLHHWKRRNEVIALPKGRRTHVFPLAQFVDGRPVDGISCVLTEIRDPRLAWLWLVRPSDLLDGEIPLELLKRNRAEQVADAAVVYAKADSYNPRQA